MNANRYVATCLALAFLTTASIAHDPASSPGKPKHGGQYVEYQDHYGIELVTTDNELIFHMTEHLQPVDLTDGTFRAIIQTKAGTNTLPLAIDGAKLTAPIDAPLPKGAKIALSGKDRDGHTIQARFVKK